MKENDLKEAAEILKIAQDTAIAYDEAVPFNPAAEVEQALSVFLQERLRKIQEDKGFEDLIKDAISSRIAEADFDQLMRLLHIFQSNVNADTANILSPFIPRAGERVPVLDNTNQKKKSGEEVISEGASKEILQAFGELNNMITSMKKANSIKEKLIHEDS